MDIKDLQKVSKKLKPLINPSSMSTMAPSSVVLERPKTLQWAKGVAILQIVVGLGIIYLLVWLVDADPQNPFLEGVKNGFMQELNKQGILTYDYAMAGRASFEPLMGIMASVLVLVALSRPSARMFHVAIGFLVLHFLSGLVQGNLVVLTPIVLGLCLSASARAYWNRPVTPAQSSTASVTTKPVPAVKPAPKKSVKKTLSSKATPKKKASTTKKKAA
jgi:hypothetical protein